MADTTINQKGATGCLQKFTSCRWTLAFMLCLLRMCQTALRQSIGMALVCMAERPPSDSDSRYVLTGENATTIKGNDSFLGGVTGENRSSTEGIYSVVIGDLLDGDQINNSVGRNASMTCQSGDREFLWDAAFEGVVLSSYYYGYLMTPLLSSYIERVVGAKRLVATCIGVGAVVNLLTPELTRLHRYLLVALRVVAGTTNGMIDPAVQSLWAVWAPRSEVAYLTAVEYAGVSMGGIFTFLISGLLCQIPLDNGWPLVFYFYGTMSMLWLILWFVLIYNKPNDHPRISPEELKYISAETQNYKTNKHKIHPPWCKMFRSPAVWAIIIASSTFMWVYSWVLCYLPMYMQDVLRYNIAENALLSSLPFVGKFISGLLCGYLADRLLRTRMSVSCNRKMFQMIGCLGCAACTVVIGFLDHNSRNLAVALLILAVTFQNITSVAFRINALDIAPRYAGFILGLTNTIAVAVSMTAPLVTSAVVYDKTREQWQIMFCVVAALSAIGGIAFLLFGSATLQDWAKSKDGDSHDIDTHDTDDNENFVKASSPIYIPTEEEQQLSHKHDLSNIENCKNTALLPDSKSLNRLELGVPSQIRHSGFYSPAAGRRIGLGSPSEARRNGHLSLAQAVRDLDAASQWSSCLSLTG